MNKQYKLGNFITIEGNSFLNGEIDLIYFSIGKEEECPQTILDKIDSMINKNISNYENCNQCYLDIRQLEIDVRLLAFIYGHKVDISIGITVSSCDSSEKEILLYEEDTILPGTRLYDEFRQYFIKRIDGILFKN